MKTVNWGDRDHPVRNEVADAFLSMPDEEVTDAQVNMRVALKGVQEPNGHPNAARRDALTAVPGHEVHPGVWLTLVFGETDTELVMLHLCHGTLSVEGIAKVDEPHWDVARDRWNRGKWSSGT
jgi:hypothetical protein